MKTVIKTYFRSKEQYQNFISTWKSEFKQARKLERNEYGNKIRKFTDLDFFFYALMRGVDPRKCYHSEERYQDAFHLLKRTLDNPHNVRRKFAKFITDDGITLDCVMKTLNTNMMAQDE